jgi:hypothetical protein
MSRTDPPPKKKKASKVTGPEAGRQDRQDVEITLGEAEISLDELEVADQKASSSSAFERVTVTPGLSEREYVARMMHQAPSERTPSTRAAGERPSGSVRRQATIAPSASPVANDELEMLALDLPEAAVAPASDVRTPPPSPPPARDDHEAQRRPSSAPRSFRPAAGDALELVDVRSKSVRPPLAPNITMRAVRDRFDVGDFSGALILAEGILESEPESVDALLYAEHCR